MSGVNRRGDKPASSPALEAELAHRHRAAKRPATEADAPRRVSTFPPHRPAKVHEGQLALWERRDGAGSDD